MGAINPIKNALPLAGPVDDKLKMIKHIGVSFDKTKLRIDEEQVNSALADGYEIIHKFETGMGMVYVLGLYGREGESN